MKIFSFVALIAMMAAPALTHAADISTTATVTDRSILSGGDYVWRDTASKIPVSVKINLQTQMAYVMRGNTLVGVTSISSGTAGFETPEGEFTVLWKEDNHWSKKYKADMPWTMWINLDGVALHSGRVTGRPASHGCVRLPEAFAAKLFQIVDKRTTVSIYREDPADKMSLEMFLAVR